MLHYKSILMFMVVLLPACADNRRPDVFRERVYVPPAPVYSSQRHYYPQPEYPQIHYHQYPQYPQSYSPNDSDDNSYQYNYNERNHRSRPKDTRDERSEVHEPSESTKSSNHDSRSER